MPKGIPFPGEFRQKVVEDVLENKLIFIFNGCSCDNDRFRQFGEGYFKKMILINWQSIPTDQFFINDGLRRYSR